MYNRLPNDLSLRDIIVDNQDGLRETHSTTRIKYALKRMIDYISDELDNDIYSLDVFIDFSKAFHTVRHKILLQKIQL